MTFRIFENILCVFCAFVFCLFPAFMEQYTHSLAAHAAECGYIVNGLEKNASLGGKDLSQYVSKFLQSSDTDFKSLGHTMEALIARKKWLDAACRNMTEASMFSRPFAFLTTIDKAIVQECFTRFYLQVVFTKESIGYALFGALIGLGMSRLIRKAYMRRRCKV